MTASVVFRSNSQSIFSRCNITASRKFAIKADTGECLALRDAPVSAHTRSLLTMPFQLH